MVSLIFQTIILTLFGFRRNLNHDKLNWRNTWLQTYDFIVLGAGTAGSVVAARLAEDSKITVLLIEAGGPQSVQSDIPALQEQLVGSRLDWMYQIVPQKNAFNGFIGNKRNISRGKAFGGCSMHNDMNYYRENSEYYDYWTELTGVQNWKYSDVLPYFRKSENNYDQNIVTNDSTVHTTGGPLSITTATPDAVLQAYILASPGLGYPITYTDGRQPFGSAIMQRNIKDGVRQSTSLVFLERNRRHNLHILGETMATKILFNDKKRAIGVQFNRKNRSNKVYAKNEVIVSLGSPASPQLLMLSGVGPKEHLQELGIELISDLNVGEFHYSPGVTINFDVKDQSSVDKPIENYDNYYKYFVKKSGPLAYKASGATCLRQVHYPGQLNLSNGVFLPRIYLMGTDLEEIVKNYKLKDQWREYYRPYLNRTYLLVIPILKRPRGSGTIRLASTNISDYPIIEPCYLCNEQDVNDLVQTVKLSMDFFMSPAMSKVVEIYKNPIPGCSPCAEQYFCDSYIRCILRTNTAEVYPTGGCRMGVPSDSNAVVDQRLRVLGVSSLRVIDSSIIPINTEQSAAQTIMIGEYGADMLKQDNILHKINYLKPIKPVRDRRSGALPKEQFIAKAMSVSAQNRETDKT